MEKANSNSGAAKAASVDNSPAAVAERFANLRDRIRSISKDCRAVGRDLVELAGLEGQAPTEYVDAMRNPYRRLLVAQGAYSHARSRFGEGAAVEVADGELRVSFSTERVKEAKRPKWGPLVDLIG